VDFLKIFWPMAIPQELKEILRWCPDRSEIELKKERIPEQMMEDIFKTFLT
jgi:hypothetical protein